MGQNIGMHAANSCYYYYYQLYQLGTGGRSQKDVASELPIIQGKLEVASLINDQKVCMRHAGLWLYRRTKGHFFV